MFKVIVAGALMGMSVYVTTFTTKYIKKVASVDLSSIMEKLGK